MENRDKINTDELRAKIEKGLDLAFERLLIKKQKEDGEFVFSQNGKIVHIKARDFKKK